MLFFLNVRKILHGPAAPVAPLPPTSAMNRQAYNPNWAFHTALRARAARWQRQQLLGEDQLKAIEAAYPLEYYRPA